MGALAFIEIPQLVPITTVALGEAYPEEEDIGWSARPTKSLDHPFKPRRFLGRLRQTPPDIGMRLV
jgi:hypothetical protein